MNASTFVNLTALGKVYGVGPRDVGLWLKNMGLREQDGRPSRKAIKEGFVKEPVTVYGSQWLWHLAKRVTPSTAGVLPTPRSMTGLR
jgi:hypothetical protein